MQRFTKAGLLVILLVMPVLVYLVLVGFGENRYDLPVLSTFTDSLKTDTVRIDRVPAFSLTRPDGTTLPDGALDGRLYVAQFITLPCDDACERVMTELTRVRDFFADEPDFLILTHVAGAPDALPAWRATYGVAAPRWEVVQGSAAMLQQLARRGYGLVSEPDRATTLALVDNQRRIRGLYVGTDPKEIERLLVEVEILLRQPPTPNN